MCPVPLVPLYLITLKIIGEAYKLLSSYLCSLVQPPTSSSLLSPYILLSTLFSNTLNLHLCSSLSVRPSITPVQNYTYDNGFVYFDL